MRIIVLWASEKDKQFSIHRKNITVYPLKFTSFYIIYLLVLRITSLKSIKLSLMILENETYFKVEILIL